MFVDTSAKKSPRSPALLVFTGTYGSPQRPTSSNGAISPRSAKQSDHQKEFQKKLGGAGGRYMLAYALEAVIGLF